MNVNVMLMNCDPEEASWLEIENELNKFLKDCKRENLKVKDIQPFIVGDKMYAVIKSKGKGFNYVLVD